LERKSSVKFIDLFSGLGGFHVALTRLGHQCVFASDIDKELQNLYYNNFGIEVLGDITKISPQDIPVHDILCAGFPCQPFSKAGRQKGIDDYRGQLIDNIIDILRVHQPRFLILENVRNLEVHNEGQTWEYIKNNLEALGYTIDKKIISPHQIGVPQHRERIFIVGALNGLEHFTWFPINEKPTSVKDVILGTDSFSDEFNIESEKIEVLEIWQEFLDRLPQGVQPYSPMWSMEFGATYPYEDIDIHKLKIRELVQYKGCFGDPIEGRTKKEIFSCLPNYIKTQKGVFPKWKQNFIRNNREFYKKYKRSIDPVLPKIKALPVESWQKFEWNCNGLEKNIWNYLVQFRGSGVRIKKTDYFPSLVTVRTQMPIIAWERRYMLPQEGALVQSLPLNLELPKNTTSCFRALGNSVNTEIIYAIAERLIILEEDLLHEANLLNDMLVV